MLHSAEKITWQTWRIKYYIIWWNRTSNYKSTLNVCSIIAFTTVHNPQILIESQATCTLLSDVHSFLAILNIVHVNRALLRQVWNISMCRIACTDNTSHLICCEICSIIKVHSSPGFQMLWSETDFQMHFMAIFSFKVMKTGKLCMEWIVTNC